MRILAYIRHHTGANRSKRDSTHNEHVLRVAQTVLLRIIVKFIFLSCNSPTVRMIFTFLSHVMLL